MKATHAGKVRPVESRTAANLRFSHDGEKKIFFLTKKLMKTILKSSAQNIPPFHLSDTIPVQKKYISKFLIRAQAFKGRLEHEAVSQAMLAFLSLSQRQNV